MPQYYDKFRKIYLGLSVGFLFRPTPALAIGTAVGEINPSASGIASWAVTTGFGIVSGAGVILVLYGAIKYNMSKGDPRSLEEAKDTITAALAGLAVVALAATIMGYLGWDILKIPGFGGGGGGVSFPD